jgi:hypothetical protein
MSSNYTADFIEDDIVDGCECCAWNMEDDSE